MKKTRLLASLLVMCVFLAGCGVEYINPYVSIPKPVATMVLEMDSVMYVMRFTLDPAAAPNTVSNFINLAVMLRNGENSCISCIQICSDSNDENG